MSEPSQRSSKRVHLYLYEDQIDKLFTIWPRANVSEIVRLALDNLIAKAEEKQKEILAQDKQS